MKLSQFSCLIAEFPDLPDLGEDPELDIDIAIFFRGGEPGVLTRSSVVGVY